LLAVVVQVAALDQIVVAGALVDLEQVLVLILAHRLQ
jgi:hypothetical protein